MTKLTPFADGSASVAIGGLTIENGADRVVIYGSLDLTRDRQGLVRARALQAIVDEAVRHLESDDTLPDALPAPPSPGSVPNPFT